MTKTSQTTKAGAAGAELTLDDLDAVNARLEPHDYMLMVEDDGRLALYRIVRGAHQVPGHEQRYDLYERM
jgi:hypothetical protein